MADTQVLARIDSWVSDGLIDEATAARLRAAERGRPHADGGAAPARAPGAGISSIFGPAPGVGEVFAYVGGGFLLAAWYVLLGRLTGNTGAGGLTWALGAAAVAVAIGGLGLRIRAGSPRLRRAAGVAFVLAGIHLGATAFFIVDGLAGRDSAAPLVAGAAAWLVAALVARRVHPSMLTQVGLIGAVVFCASAIMRWLEVLLFGAPALEFGPQDPESPLRAVLVALGWGVTAIVLGGVGLLEARSARAGSAPRSALTRFAAGMTAILGTAMAVLTTGYLGSDEFGRLIEPAVGDLILLLVSTALLERAFRREASSYVYPAALGVIIALSDLNANYLATATSGEFALLVEGAILLAAGLAFDRLRRRVGAGEATASESELVPESGPA